MAAELTNARALITGASSGIGAATAQAFAARGTHLALMARREDRLAEVADRCIAAGAPDVRIVPADLSELNSIESVLNSAIDHLGGLDVLVNNAGMPMRRDIRTLTAAEVEQTMAVNYFARVRMTLQVLPAMLERDRGSIVNVSSVGGRFPILGEAAYCGSKAALCGFTETLAAELVGTGVDARLILPGPIDTEIWDQPGQDDPFYTGDLEPPRVVADGIAAAVEGDGIEHWLPDLEPIARIKHADLDGFIAGMVASVSADSDGSRGGSTS
ncbi:MAG: SDR family NAD(P)-dependent oxidoreductase [Microthrixaceae bacterium]